LLAAGLQFLLLLFSDFGFSFLVGIPWDTLVSAKDIYWDGIGIGMEWICRTVRIKRAS
jgi:hypothetical protein